MDQSNRTYDILIIGGGAVGCAVARELSRSQRSVALVEKEADVAAGTSGRNSAVVHAGFNNRPGSLMAQLCVEGNQGFAALCRQLEVPYRKTGKLLVAFDQEDLAVLRRLLAQGRPTAAGDCICWTRPSWGVPPPGGGIGAMVSPETGIFDPFLYTVALAENAVANGVHFFFRHPVTAIAPGSQGGYVVTAGGETFSARVVVNAAGLFSDRIAALAGVEGYRIYPCRGEYFILDQIAGTCCPCPSTPPPRRGRGDWGFI
ncbi:MAG: NAD(P)/FAD-dependent oxidoreductase [Evtepia gabavorous]